MVGKRSPESVKIRAYIQVRCKNGLCANDIYHELCELMENLKCRMQQLQGG